MPPENHAFELEVENRLATIGASTAETRAMLKELRDMMVKIEERHNTRLTDLEGSFNKYKGAWGFLLIIVSGIVAAFQIMRGWSGVHH